MSTSVMVKKILLVEDDVQVRRMLRTLLAGEGFDVAEAATATDALAQVKAQAFDLVTLDLHLGDDDGLELLREIRAISDMPIIMITARSDDIDRIVGLECGADDYITKPFNLREVLARVRAVMRRQRREAVRDADTGSRYEFAEWCLDIDARTVVPVKSTATALDLTPAEFDLLVVFVTAPGRILSRATLLDRLGGANAQATDRSIDTLVARIRKKLEDADGGIELIKTVRGLGYRLDVPVRRR